MIVISSAAVMGMIRAPLYPALAPVQAPGAEMGPAAYPILPAFRTGRHGRVNARHGIRLQLQSRTLRGVTSHSYVIGVP